MDNKHVIKMQLIHKLVSHDMDVYEGELENLVKFANAKGFASVYEYYLSLSNEELTAIASDYFETE